MRVHELAKELDQSSKDTIEELLELGFSIVAPLKKSLQATERLIKMARALGLHSDPSQIIENYDVFLGLFESK